MADAFCGLRAVFRREAAAAVTSSFLYVTAAVFTVCCSAVFFVFGGFFVHGEARIDTLFPVLQILCCIFIPLFTMRSWADEKSKQTDLILLTLPVTEAAVVLGKFAAVMVQAAILLVLSGGIPAAVCRFGVFDGGLIFCGYLGVFLLSGAVAAAGVFFSCLCGKQVPAALCSFFFLAVVFLSNIVPRVAAVPDFAVRILTAVSFENRLASFFRGIVDSRDCVFFILVAAFFLGLARLVIVLRRWR